MIPFVILGATAAVVVALFLVLWRERTTARDARVALLAGAVLAGWAGAATVLAQRGAFQAREGWSVPPVGINLIVVLSVVAVSLAGSRTLRGLLTRQSNLILVHLWRLVGFLFLALMTHGQVPALWALPAGIGDIIVGVAAPWVAWGVDRTGGRWPAILWNVFGIVDLILAVGLGIMTSPGPTQVIFTAPTAEVMTRFPMALVPTFLVPVAFTLHVCSLWQLLGGTWRAHVVPPTEAQRASSRTTRR